MEIDVFTLVAQVINFLILVLLLRRFLYQPILRTMDERARRIAAELDEAAASATTARLEASQCHAEKVELEDSRGEMLSRAQDEAAALKREMVRAARQDVAESKARWSRAVEQEKQAFLENLRRRAGEEVYAISRQVITDLANVELERHIIEIFIERLRAMDYRECEAIAAACRRAHTGAAITSSFPIERMMRSRLRGVVKERIATDIELHFEESADLICGIELRAGGKKAAWSLQNYLETLDERLSLAFSGARAQAAAPQEQKDA